MARLTIGFEDDVAILRDFRLVVLSEGGDVLEMHRLVQLSTRKWLEAYEWQEKFKQLFVGRMAESFPTGAFENWVTCQRLFPHVERAVYYRPADGRLEEAWARLLYGTCRGVAPSPSYYRWYDMSGLSIFLYMMHSTTPSLTCVLSQTASNSYGCGMGLPGLVTWKADRL